MGDLVSLDSRDQSGKPDSRGNQDHLEIGVFQVNRDRLVKMGHRATLASQEPGVSQVQGVKMVDQDSQVWNKIIYD